LYLDNSELVFEEENLYTVGPVLVNPAKAKHFTNALHDSYDEQDLKGHRQVDGRLGCLRGVVRV
jgi:hypothetical protein